jgi:hypothetical protein
MINQKTVDDIYSQLRTATEKAHQTGQDFNWTKAALETALNRGLADGSITGKNAALRAASASEVLAAEQADADKAEEAFEHAKHALALARIWESWLKMSVRLEELTHERD